MNSVKQTAREWFSQYAGDSDKHTNALDTILDYCATVQSTKPSKEVLETVLEICKLGLAPESTVSKVNGEDQEAENRIQRVDR